MNGGGTSSLQNPQFSADPTYPQGTTFAFRKRWGQIDWRKIASVDVDRIAKEVNFQVLQENIMNITFCNIETEGFENLDPNFIKLFRLAQLIIEYLLHSQQHLSSQSKTLELKVQLMHQDLEKATSEMNSRNEELKALKKENRKRRKVIEAYQDMINAGAIGLHTCPVCKREFVSAEYLQSHIYRRHPNHLQKPELDKNMEKQQQENQEELEARLLEQVTERLLVSERQLKEELSRKEQETLSLQIKDFEEWKKKENEKMTIEMDEFKKPIIQELRELQQEKVLLEKSLKEKEAELLNTQARRQSHLGHLEGARELILDETNQLNESKAEIKVLKESLESQMQEMQSALKKQDKSWQKKMHKLSSSYHDQFTESVTKLDALEHTVREGSQNDSKDKKVSKKLKSLQQKLKQQEELLQCQQDKLITLSSREPSPTHATPLQDEESISVTETITDTEDDDVDFPGNRTFSPFSHRPMVKTMYNHNPEYIEKIREQTRAIFSDTLVQTGLVKDAIGFKSSEFEKQMNRLQQERAQKMETHYHFAEHRRRLVNEIEKIAASDHVPELPQNPIFLSKQKSNNMSASETIRSMGKPPKPRTKAIPTSVEQLDTENVAESAGCNRSNESVSVTETDSSDSSNDDTPPPDSVHHKPGDREHTKVTFNTEPEETNPPHGHSTVRDQEQLGMNVSKVDSPWDSEDDSIEEMFAAYNGRTSSTPIKIHDGSQRTTEGTGSHKQDNASLDSFELSSSDPPLPKAIPTPIINVPSGKPASKTATSQSALTSVSMDDFDFDSDPSDLDITTLT